MRPRGYWSRGRGRAGGLARARQAWRSLDETFMPESAKQEAYVREYERYAASGRARASTAPETLMEALRCRNKLLWRKPWKSP
jgi:hypothetical protein